MEGNVYNPHVPKKSTNLSVNSDVLRQTRDHMINVSRVLEQRLVEILPKEKRVRWMQENGEAIEAYNQHIQPNGTFSDGLREF